MDKHFNTARPGIPELHQINPLSRIDQEILSLIGQQRYGVLHALRQTGKTTCMLALRDHLYVEAAQVLRSDVYQAMGGIHAEVLPGVIFDQRPEALPCEQRMQASDEVTASGRPVLVPRG